MIQNKGTGLSKPIFKINFEPTLKQHLCFQMLLDNSKNIIFFGGAGGGGKTYLAVSWVLIMCMNMDGVVYGITRNRMVQLKKTTLITLLNQMNNFNLQEDVHYKFDRTLNIITFWNNSKIILFENFYYPSDPDFDKFGSFEFTGVVIDEASEISRKGFEVIQTRIRYKLKEFGLTPKLLIVSNPTNNFIKDMIYVPYTKGELPKEIGVVLSKAIDNPHIDKSYIQSLERMTGPVRQRMLEGSWDYQQTEGSIFDPEKLVNLFYNYSVPNINKTRYLSCDPASTGLDYTTISVWEGNKCLLIDSFKFDTLRIVEKIKDFMKTFNINVSNVVIDSVGVGVGVADHFRGCYRFVSNGKPTNPIYDMIKSQLYFLLAQFINNDQIYIEDKKHQDKIVQELSLHVQWDYDKDGKTKIIPKDKVKQMLGRSPDFADNLMMKMVFEIKKPPKMKFV